MRWLFFAGLLSSCAAYTSAPSLCEPPNCPTLSPTLAASQPTNEEPTPNATLPLVAVSAPSLAQCSEAGYLPVAPVDINGDGLSERPAATRDKEHFWVRLYQVPGLQKTFEARLRADSLLIATTPSSQKTTGDLWVYTGVAKEKKGSQWSFALLHLEEGALVPVFTTEDPRRPDLRFDLDNDGDIDPIVYEASGPLALLNGAKHSLSSLTGATLFGWPARYGFEAPLDLDGDKDLDLLAHGIDWVGVFDLKSKTLVWKKEAKSLSAGLVQWDKKPALLITEGDTDETRKTYLVDLSASHREVASLGSELSYRGLRYDPLPTYVDPDGAGLLIGSYGASTLWARPGQKPLLVPVGVARPADLSLGRQPLPRFVGASSLLGARYLSFGDAAMGGMGETEYVLSLYSPSGQEQKVLHNASIPGDGQVEVSYVDLDGDGFSEILLSETSSYMTCDMGGGGGGKTISLLGADGTLLYKDETRYSSFDVGGPYYDATAKVSVLDLGAKGRALRFRTWEKEWWVLPPALPLPTNGMPTCLE